MMKYERLTKSKWTNDNCKPVYDKNGDIVMDKELFDLLITEHNRLAELEDKIEQGTLIELPCKVGHSIFRVYPKHQQAIYEWVIVKAEIYNDEIVFEDDSGNKFGIDKLGKTVFLTREEAEKRLKELQNG